MGQNRVLFKQLLAAGGVQVCQIDACRVGGVNENLAIILLAAQAGVPVIPHAGGCGLSEVVQHLAMFDFVALGTATSLDGRLIEWADHLHEHFATPAAVVRGSYVTPTAPGSGAEMLAAALRDNRHAP
jgi:L-fuconate dehydratase